MNFVRTHPRVVYFGPTYSGGLAFRDFKVETGIDTIKLLMRNLQIPGQIKDILLVFLQTWQIVLGMDKLLLQYPDLRAPHWEGQYYVWLQHYLEKISGSLEIHGIQSPLLEHDHDHRLMELACVQNFTDAQVRHIYYCAHFLQVMTISDISAASGMNILKCYYRGVRTDTYQSASRMEEIVQDHPGPDQ